MTENSHPADHMDWCPECQMPVEIADQSTEQAGYEERAEYYAVIYLECGHSIDSKLEGPALRNYLRSIY